MRFTPLTPDRLVEELAGWIDDARALRPRIGFDGPDEIGTDTLADSVGDRIRALGRPVIRVSSTWWWRPASLRLELGRTDVDMLRTGWIDAAALRREVLEPLGPGGSGSYLRRLRDPATDRSVRDERTVAPSNAAVLLNGPFLQADPLPLDAVVHLIVSQGTLSRRLPADRQWWIDAFERYRVVDRPAEGASVLVAYDHPAAPAVAWPGRR